MFENLRSIKKSINLELFEEVDGELEALEDREVEEGEADPVNEINNIYFTCVKFRITYNR